MHGKDNIAIKRYVISFWNGIDLRYKLLKGPSVKISIAGIIISRVRNSRIVLGTSSDRRFPYVSKVTMEI